jgi:hypothetical protein
MKESKDKQINVFEPMLKIYNKSQLDTYLNLRSTNPHLLTFIEIPRSHTEPRDVQPMIDLLHIFLPQLFSLRSSINIIFEGFDDYPQPMHAIPEGIAYYRKLDEEFPALLYLVQRRPSDGNFSFDEFAQLIRMMVAGNAAAFHYQDEEKAKQNKAFKDVWGFDIITAVLPTVGQIGQIILDRIERNKALEPKYLTRQQHATIVEEITEKVLSLMPELKNKK